MNVIITMAGEGSRFKKMGINKPKHEIIAKNKSLFTWSMLSLEDFFSNEFIFIVRKGFYSKSFIEKESTQIGIRNYKIVEIEYLTDGQATTAFCADSYIDGNDSCIIYNIDTYVEPKVIKKSDISITVDGFIPVIQAKGNRWSFVRVDENGRVVEVAEKVPISDLATIGLYYFKSWNLYKSLYNNLYIKNISDKIYKEKYIAPLYQELIYKKGIIEIKILDNSQVSILGTPEEIVEFDNYYLINNAQL